MATTNREIKYILRARDAALSVLRRNAKGMKEIGVEAKRSKEETEALRREQEKLNRDIDKLRQGRERVERIRKSYTGLTHSIRRAVIMQNRFRAALLGFGGIGAGVGVGAVLADMVKTYASFEKQMSAVAAIANATDSEMAALTETAKELGRTTEFTGTQAGEGLEFLVRAGFTARQAIGALPATLDLATAAAIDLGRSSDIVSNIMSTFSIPIHQTAMATDVLATVNSSANTNILQLAEAMKYAGPIANGFGISVNETASAIGVLGDSGLQGSLAGTGIRMALIDAKMIAVGEHSKKAQEAFKRLKIDPDTFDPEKVGLNGMIKALRDANVGMNELVVMFGARAAPSVQVLVKGYEKLESLTQKTVDQVGESARQAAAMRDNLAGDWKALRSAIEGAFVAIGEQIGGALRGTVQFLTSVVQAMQGAELTFKRFEASAKATAAALAALAKVGAVIAGLLALRAALFVTAKAVAVLRFALKALMSATPLGWVARIVTAIWVLKDVTFQWGGETLRVKDVIVTVWNIIKETIGPVISGITNALSGWAPVVREAVATIGPLVLMMGEMFGKAALVIIKMSATAWDAVIGGANGMVSALASLWDDMTAVVGIHFSGFITRATQTWERITTSGQILVNGIKKTGLHIQSAWNGVMSVLMDKWATFLEFVAGGIVNIPGLGEEASAISTSAFEARTRASAEDHAASNRQTEIDALTAANALLRKELAKPLDTSSFKEAADRMEGTIERAKEAFKATEGTNIVSGIVSAAEGQVAVAVAAIQSVLDRTAARVNQQRIDGYRRRGGTNANYEAGTTVTSTTETDDETDTGTGAGSGGGSESDRQRFLQQLLEEAQALERQTIAAKEAVAIMREYGVTKEQATKVAELVAEAQQLGFSGSEVEKLREKFVRLQETKDKALLIGTDFATSFKSSMRSFIDDVTDATKVASRTVQSLTSITGNFIDNVVDDGMSLGDALKSSVGSSLKEIGKMLMDHVAKVLVFKHMLGITSIGGVPLFPSANGNAFTPSGPVQAFAKGGVFDRPTTFDFKTNGAMRKGVMGEAGPEAVMPLTRGPDGKLGVTSHGGAGGMTQITLNTTVTLDGQPGGGKDPKAAERMGRALENQIRTVVVDTIKPMLRPGGALSKAKG